MNVCTYRTHTNWADTLKNIRLKDDDEAAFWRTSNKNNFQAVKDGEILFFCVDDVIIGGGTVAGFEASITIVDLWNKYRNFSGAKSLLELENNIREKSVNSLPKGIGTYISYIKLSNIFWFSNAVAEAFTKGFDLKSVQNPVKKYTIDIHERV